MSEVAPMAPAELELQAEACRRLTRSAPSLTTEQVTAWLAYATAHGGRLVFTFDGGCFAEYPTQATAGRQHALAKGVEQVVEILEATK